MENAMSDGTPRPVGSLAAHQLLAVASHELRGPIGVARGFVRMLQQDLAGQERGARVASSAWEALERVVRLLDEMSEYSRLTRGDLRIDIVPVQWPALLATVRGNAVLPAVPHLEWLEAPVPPSRPVAIDAARVERALVTLIEAVTRAQTSDGFVSIGLSHDSDGSETTPALDVAVLAEGPVDFRKPDLTRGGLGFRLVVADAVVAIHGARLEERWQGGRWTGYRILGLQGA
jgi:signal transduction histidine kinase